MGLFGITLKKIEAIPGDIVHGAENLFGGGNGNIQGNPNPAPPTSYNPAPQGRGGYSPGPVNVVFRGGTVAPPPGQPHPNISFLTTPPPSQQPGLAPGQKRDKNGKIIPVGAAPQQANSDPVGNFIKTALVKPITNTFAGDIVEPARSLTASLSGNQAAMNAADQRAAADQANSAPQLLLKGIGNFGRAVANAPSAVAAEATNNPVASQHASQAGLKALNQSFEGPFLTGPEDVVAHNIKGAAADAQKAGLDTKQSVGSAVVKSTIGAAALAYPDAGILKGVKGALTGADSAMAEGGAAADSAEPRLPEPNTTEEDVNRVMQSNPLNPPEKTGGEPLPTPPPETAHLVPQSKSDAELDSLYKSAPEGEAPNPQGAPDLPGGSQKVPAPNPNPQTYELPEGRPGDYRQGFISKGVFHYRVNKATQATLSALDDLSQDDRANFVHYAQGSKNIANAEDPAAVQTAVDAWRNLSDMGHAASTASDGGKTAYKQNYFPGYYVDKEGNPIHTTGSQNFSDPTDVKGFRSSRAKYDNRQQAMNHGVTPMFDDPAQDILQYTNGLKRAVGSNIVKKGISEADKGLVDAGSTPVTLKDKTAVKVSEQGEKQLKKLGETRDRSSAPVAALRKVNRGLTKSLISLGAPHALIIPRRAWGAGLEMKLSTAAAKLSKGLDDSAERPQLENNELAIRIGSPIHDSTINAGVSSRTNTASLARKLNPFTVPKRLVFDHELPFIHNWLIGLAKDYMDAHGIDYDSAAARQIGDQINAVMGYDRSTGLLGESVFAPALLKSTAKMYVNSARPGYGIAKGAVLGEQLTNQMAGFISKSLSNQVLRNENQQTNNDSVGQTFIKNILNGGSVYTPYHNTQGEQIMLRPTGEYQADLLRDFTTQKSNGDHGTNFGIPTPKEIAANLLQTGRNIASPAAGDIYSVVKNKMFNGAHVYNPYAPLGEEVAQGAVSLGSSALPINIAGLINSRAADHLPNWLRENVQVSKSTPDSLRSAGSSFGLNPVGDQTTGNGPSLNQWFKGIDKGHSYISANTTNATTQDTLEKAYDEYFSKQKDDKGRTILMGPEDKAAENQKLAANPTLLKAVQLTYQSQGKGNYSPHWDLNPQALAVYLRYEAEDPGNLQRNVDEQKFPWLSDVLKADQAWASTQQFSGNTVNGPNYVPYPQLPNGADDKLNQIGQISATPAANRTPQQIAQLRTLENDPDVQAAYSILDNYTNDRRATYPGLSQINYNPGVPASVQKWTNDYLAASSAARKSMKASNPGMYAAMQQSLENQSLFDVEKQGGIGYLGGQPSSSLLSGAYSLGNYDIAKGTNPNGTTSYALENFGSGAPAAPPSLGAQENLAETTTPISSGSSFTPYSKGSKAYTTNKTSRSSSKASATLSKVIAGEKEAAQNRDAERAQKAAKRAVDKFYSPRSPRRMSINIKGQPKEHKAKMKQASVSPAKLAKIKVKQSGNTAKLKVR